MDKLFDKILNLLVAMVVIVTNFTGILTIVVCDVADLHYDKFLMLFTMLASILHHVSANNRGLEPIVFKKYSEQFLWIDRLFALMSIMRILYLMVCYNLFQYLSFYGYVMIAFTLLLLLLSDIGFRSNKTNCSKIIYAILHGGWHIMAFLMASSIYLAIYTISCTDRHDYR